MPRKGFSDAQKAMVVKELEHGGRVEDLCPKLGISAATMYNWKRKFGGMGVTEIRKLRILEEENAKLRKLVADLSLDKVMLQDILSKKH